VWGSLGAYLQERAAEREQAESAATQRTPGGRGLLRAVWSAIRRRLSGPQKLEPAAVDRPLARLRAARCPVCEAMDDREDLVLRIAAREVLNPKVVDHWRRGDLLCLPHLRGILRYAPDERTREWVVEDALAKLGALWAHLESYTARYGCRDREQFTDAEWASVARTIAFLAGEPRDGLRDWHDADVCRASQEAEADRRRAREGVRVRGLSRLLFDDPDGTG